MHGSCVPSSAEVLACPAPGGVAQPGSASTVRADTSLYHSRPLRVVAQPGSASTVRADTSLYHSRPLGV